MRCFLKVKSAEHSPAGLGFIVLDEFDAGQELLEVVEVVALFEITAGVGVDSRLYKKDIRDTLWGHLELHIRLSPINVPLVGVVKNEKLKVKSFVMILVSFCFQVLPGCPNYRTEDVHYFFTFFDHFILLNITCAF